MFYITLSVLGGIDYFGSDGDNKIDGIWGGKVEGEVVADTKINNYPK